MLGVHNTARSWIKSQYDPKKPVGTFINVNSGLAGFLMPGNSAYGSSKLAVHRYMEFLDLGEFANVERVGTAMTSTNANGRISNPPLFHDASRHRSNRPG